MFQAVNPNALLTRQLNIHMFKKGEVDLIVRKNSVCTSIDVVSEDVAVGEHPSHNLRRTKIEAVRLRK